MDSSKLVTDLVDPLSGREGTVFDKQAPTGPPTPVLRDIPPHLRKIEKFFESLVADEGLLMDCALDRAMAIVQFNCAKRRAGADFFASEPATPEGVAALSAPLAVELYKQALASVLDRKEEYVSLLKEAQEEARRGSSPTIHLP